MDENKIGAHVLYELLVYKEWELDREKQKKISKYSLLGVKKPKSLWLNLVWGLFKRVPWPEEDLAKAGSLLLPWQISVSPNGKLVAILEDSVLEVRQSKDEYTTVVGRAAVPKDKRPQLRKMAWSPDSNLIAIASSDGSVRIYDYFGSLIFKIPLLSPEKPPMKLITGLEFISAREKKGEWELLIIYASGFLECYNIASLDKCTLEHTSVLSETGISCTAFSPQYGILFLSVKPLNLLTFESKKLSTGITAWRLLNEEPYYQRVFPTDDELSIVKLHGKMWKYLWFFSSSDCICKIVMAPNNEYLATLHASGVVFIWAAPSLRLLSSLDKFDFKKHKVLVPLSETGICSHVIDVEWRKDSKLIVAWKNGTISIHDVNTSVVLTYFGPDFLHSLPRLASASSLHGFLALECETECVPHPSTSLSSSTASTLHTSGSDADLSLNDSKSKSEDSSSDEDRSFLDVTTELFYTTMYVITDLERYEPKRKSVKFVQRIFRLLGVKMTTPEELFERYLKNEEFEKAFEICQEYGLDVIKVYMRQWRTSEVSEQSIQDYLANIVDDDWVLNECLNRIPETLTGAKKLSEFSLNFTNIKPILDAEREVSSEFKLTEQQKQFIIARLKLLDYAAKLETYELIVDENSYSMNEYEKFRQQSIVKSAIDFARSAQTEAVKLLMTNHSEEVIPYWLNILDNYPESIKPSKYSAILPECDGDDVPVKWETIDRIQKKDWAQLDYLSEFSHLLPSEEEYKFDEMYTFDSSSLSAWYIKRALKLEDCSTVLDNAVELLELGILRNIKGLEEVLFELKMLGALVYDLNIDIHFSSFRHEDIQKKLQLFVKENEDFCKIMLQWIHPYMEHYAQKGSSEWLSLYTNFMISNSRHGFGNIIKYFHYLLNGHLSLVGSAEVLLKVIIDCVYAYNHFDKLEETETLIVETIDWLCALSDEIRKVELFEKLYGVKNELKGAQILIKNNCEKSLGFIHEIKGDFKNSRKFLNEFTRTILSEFNANIEEWKEFLADLLDLQKHCFTLVPVEYCYKVYVSDMLKSGLMPLIEYSPNLLSCVRNIPDKPLSFDSSVEIVIEASQFYFNSASHSDDTFMHLAKTCLLLIKDDSEVIKKELDLIFSVRLLSDLGVNILPLQVRQTENKMKLIDLCFERSDNAYHNPDLVYKLASRLHVYENSIKSCISSVTLRLAQEAFKRHEYTNCADFCYDLISQHCSEGWKITMQLADCDQFYDNERKRKLIAFSLLHAPPRMLPQIIKIRSKLEDQSVLLDLHTLIQKCFRGEVSLSTLVSKCSVRSNECTHIDVIHDVLLEFCKSWRNGYFKSSIEETCSKDFTFIVPSFYSSLHLEKCHFSPVNSSSSNSILLLMNTFLTLLLKNQEYEQVVDVGLLPDVLTACSILSSVDDSVLSLSFLLCHKDPKKSLEFFNHFNESSGLYQFFFYFLGLKELSTESSDCFNMSPYEVFSSFLDRRTDSECSQLLKKQLINYKNFIEACQVTTLECGINTVRFKQDENYKHDTIFGLAMSEEYDNLKLAIELAKKNNISECEVVISHINSLLLNNVISTVNERINDAYFIEMLNANREQCIERLGATLPTLSGTNYQQLIAFFSVIKVINNDYVIWDLTAKEHISLLKKINSLSKDIDYKQLVSKENDLHITLKHLMQEDNINLINKLIKSLPAAIRNKYSVGMFFCQWAINDFFSKCTDVSFKQSVINFESLHKFFSKLSEDELKYFSVNTIFSEKIMAQMDSDLRKRLLISLIDWCHSNNFRELLPYLLENLELLNRLWDDDYDDFNSDLKKYVFLVEDHYRKHCDKDNLINIFKDAVSNLSLKENDLVYLHKVSGIDTSLMEMIDTIYLDSPQSSIAAERKKRFCLDTEDISYHKVVLNKQKIDKEEDLIANFMNSLKKSYQNVDEIFDTGIKDYESFKSFQTLLLSKTTTFDQLLAYHRLIPELPDSICCNQDEIEDEILETLTLKIDSEFKYSLAEVILQKCSINFKKYISILESISNHEAERKLFVCWVCCYSDDRRITENTIRFIANEGEDLCSTLCSLPRTVVCKLIPNLVGTAFYERFISFLIQSKEYESVFEDCIDCLEKAHHTSESVRLKVLKSGYKFSEELVATGLRSFQSQFMN